MKEIVKKSKEYIKRNYKIESNEIEAHFHYLPTVLLLHIHFVLVNNKVGIGTTNPTYKLHVLGDTLISGNLTNPTIIGLS